MWARRSFGVEAAVGALNRRLAKEFDAVVVTSQFAADEFADTGARLELAPLGVDLATFHPSAGSPADDGVLKFCYVGRLSHEKSPQLAVATVAELHRRGHRVRLDLYGTGPDQAELQAAAGDAPVSFHGFVAGRPEVAKRIAAADISLSVCPAETFGLAVLEALACGTPVVTSNRGGAHELVDATSGDAGRPDPASLADAVETLLPRLGSELRAAAQARRTGRQRQNRSRRRGRSAMPWQAGHGPKAAWYGIFRPCDASSYGSRMVLPVVRRASRSMCACAASRSA